MSAFVLWTPRASSIRIQTIMLPAARDLTRTVSTANRNDGTAERSKLHEDPGSIPMSVIDNQWPRSVRTVVRVAAAAAAAIRQTDRRLVDYATSRSSRLTLGSIHYVLGRPVGLFQADRSCLPRSPRENPTNRNSPISLDGPCPCTPASRPVRQPAGGQKAGPIGTGVTTHLITAPDRRRARRRLKWISVKTKCANCSASKQEG